MTDQTPPKELIDRAKEFLGHTSPYSLVKAFAHELLTAEERGASRERERCAAIADSYAEVNIQMAGDTILADPILHGAEPTDAAIEKSERLQIDGTIASAMFHAAQNIAAAIRALPNPPEQGEQG